MMARVAAIVGAAFLAPLTTLALWELLTTGNLTLVARTAPEPMSAITVMIMMAGLGCSLFVCVREIIRKDQP